MRVQRIGMLVVLAAAVASGPAFAGTVTVGRFYTEIAHAKGLAPTNPASAEAGLRGAGFNLPDLALDSSLTEGDMASISTLLGVSATTQRPTEPAGESLLKAYMAYFGGRIANGGGRGGDRYGLYSGSRGGNQQGGNNQGGNNQGGNNNNQGGDHNGDHSRSVP